MLRWLINKAISFFNGFLNKPIELVERKEKYHCYLVSYSYPKGYGMCEVFRKKKLKSYDDVIETQKVIEGLGKVTNIVIINYIYLRKTKQ